MTILEKKIKNGFLGRKEKYPLIPFNVKNGFTKNILFDIIHNSDLPKNIKGNLQLSYPTLINSYSRRYFQSADRSFRITLDSDQIFYKVESGYNSFIGRSTDNVNLILELKYNQDMEHRAQFITNHFPFRMTKNSKYSNGIERILFL